MEEVEQLTELKPLSNENAEPKMEDLLFQNNTREVEAMLEKDPHILLENPKLIKLARTSDMVETLLQFKKLQSLCQDIKMVDPEESEQREVILKGIKKTFSTVLKRWPSIAVDILNKHIKFSGYCAEDPQLEAEIDFSLVSGSDVTNGRCVSLSKPEHLIHLSELNVNNPTTRDILLHPVVLTYLHIKMGADWGTFLLKLILLLSCMAATIIDVFSLYFHWFCDAIHINETAQERENFLSLIMLSVYILFVIHFVAELFKICILRKYYFGGAVFQAYLCLSFYLVINDWNDANYFLHHINFNLVLVFNLLISLSSGNLSGKYILLSWGVLRTMLKVMSPILFLLGALAASEFVLRYDEVLMPYFDELADDTGNMNQTEICNTIAPFTGSLGEAERSFFLKSIFHIVNVMYGQSDTADITNNYDDLMSQSSTIDWSYAVHWIVSTILTTIILMNLFIGVTLGDVREIEKNADCQIVQLQLKKLYLKAAWKSCYNCLFRLCRKKNGAKNAEDEERILVMYPNKFKKGCAIVGKNGIWFRLSSLYSMNYILGCSKVRKSVIQHFE